MNHDWSWRAVGRALWVMFDMLVLLLGFTFIGLLALISLAVIVARALMR